MAAECDVVAADLPDRRQRDAGLAWRRPSALRPVEVAGDQIAGLVFPKEGRCVFDVQCDANARVSAISKAASASHRR